MPKIYPVAFGVYDQLCEIREQVDGFDDLYLIGRNGMRRYDNPDYSLLTAMSAVNHISAGSTE